MAKTLSKWRMIVLGIALCAMPLSLVWHLANLKFDFLIDQGDLRTIRTETLDAYRGVITDRNGELLAVSTPVVTLFANPQEFDRTHLAELAKSLGENKKQLRRKFDKYKNKQFMYLARHLPPHEARKVLSKRIKGVYSRDEFQRYYPAGEVAAHVVGFTGIDDQGQEGLELALDEWLSGTPGAKRVKKDRKGAVVKDMGLIKAAQPGNNVSLSIDLRLQYLAYRELKTAMLEQGAASGSVVMLDVVSGEILAMVNQPSFNPNDRSVLEPSQMRNRAVTDVVEPGSTVKPLTVLAALESGKYTPDSRINTHPGYIRVGGKTFLDPRNYGEIDVRTVLQKSSQVGISKLALDLKPDVIRNLFFRFGFGQSTGIGFPGESLGVLPNHIKWHPVERANFAFGYGLSVTPLQLAQAYLTLASNGIFRNVSLLHGAQQSQTQPVVEEKYSRQIVGMLEAVTRPGGTAPLAHIDAYSTAGKTGTAHKVGEFGYEDDKYVALFAGIAPVDNPRVVTVVIVNEPTNDRYYGGEAAAPLFARITEGALRLMNVSPGLSSMKVVRR